MTIAVNEIDGDVLPADAAKTHYKNERIQLPTDLPLAPPSTGTVVTGAPEPWFTNDRSKLGLKSGFHISGKCPSCHHTTMAVCATEYLADDITPAAEAHADTRLQSARQIGVRNFVSSPAPSSTSKTQVTVLRCACTQNHRAPTSGAFGCGSEWLLRVNYDASKDTNPATLHVVPATDSYKYWPAADAAAAQVPHSLTAAEAIAKNWAGVLAAIIALLGVGTLIGSASTVEAYSMIWKVAFGIVDLIALLAAVAVLYQSNLATFGSPRIKDALRPSDLANADLDPLTQASASVRKLQLSVRFTALSVVMTIAAVAILLFKGPASTTPTYKVTYRMASGVVVTTSCGSVAYPSAGAGGDLTFTPANGGSSLSIPTGKKVAVVSC
jgi:hypothetical protein